MAVINGASKVLGAAISTPPPAPATPVARATLWFKTLALLRSDAPLFSRHSFSRFPARTSGFMRYGTLSIGLSVAALVVAVAALASRNNPGSSTTKITPFDSVRAAARTSYAFVDTRRAQRADRGALLDLHGEEIRRTFDVASVLLGDSVAVALIRYSIGARVYHDTHWLRRVGPGWHPTADLSARRNERDPFADGDSTHARAVIDSAATWLKEGAPRWW